MAFPVVMVEYLLYLLILYLQIYTTFFVNPCGKRKKYLSGLFSFSAFQKLNNKPQKGAYLLIETTAPFR